MVPQVAENTLNSPLARWETQSPRYTKDLIIKNIAMAALCLFGAGLIAGTISFVAVPLAIKILLSMGIAALTFSAVLKVNLTVHPYYFKRYNTEPSAEKICKKINRLQLSPDCDLEDPKLSETHFKSMGNYIPKNIKEWIRYGFIDKTNGEELIKLYKIHINLCLEMTKIKADQGNFDRDQYDALNGKIQRVQSQFENLLATFVIPDLPFNPND